MTKAIVVRIEGDYVITAQGADLLSAIASQASDARDEAVAAAAVALAAGGVGEYPDTGAGLSGTTEGETFWVDLGDGTGQVYRHDPGPTATALQKFIIDPTDSGAAAIFAGGVPTTAALGSSAGEAMVGVGNDRTQADVNAEVVSVFDYIPAALIPDILAGTSTTDVTAYIHQARDAVDGTGKELRFPGGKYYVGELVFSGSNYVLNTSVAAFQQKPGLTGDGGLHPIITFPSGAHDIRMANVRLFGNIATDEDEYSHGIAVISADNITLGDVTGTDIRGDVLYTYGRNTSEAELQIGLVTGVISGSNIYRCIVAMAGGDATIAGIVNNGGVGFCDFDAEPNPEAGYQPVAVRVGFIRGATIAATSASTGNINDSISIDDLDLDGDRLQDSTPGYPAYPGSNAIALSINRTDTVRVGKAKIRNYDSYPVSLADLWKSVQIGSLDFDNCGSVETTFKSIVVQQGTAGSGTFRVGKVTGTLASPSHMIFFSDAGLLRIDVGSVETVGGRFGARLTGQVGLIEMDLGGGGGEICFPICENMQIGPTTITNSASAYGFFQCKNMMLNSWNADFGSGLDYTSASTGIVATNSDINGTSADGVNILAGGGVWIGGINVLVGQGAAIAAPTGGTTIDSEARTAIGLILARMRASTPSIAT